MCNTTPSSPSYSSFSFNKSQFIDPEKPIDPPDPSHDPLHDLLRWPSLSEVVEEMAAIGKISGPTALTGLVMYSRSLVSMLFLGCLAELELAGSCLAIGFTNITSYSVLSGLALGMETICGQDKSISAVRAHSFFTPFPTSSSSLSCTRFEYTYGPKV
ncbi:MATE efflux family protein 7 [Carex littledalei]|uniref:MATE efflux family protein 7 n=1 Tax=Carex littledalei TaxID=544730 RepID=A0A833R973_9POAL|nr:MATE efflux family protein 7 [Carex littledalei]